NSPVPISSAATCTPEPSANPSVVLYSMPRSVTSVPPSAVISPPRVADVVVMSAAEPVVTVGITASSPPDPGSGAVIPVVVKLTPKYAQSLALADGLRVMPANSKEPDGKFHQLIKEELAGK